jgi:hypothetical protein
MNLHAGNLVFEPANCPVYFGFDGLSELGIHCDVFVAVNLNLHKICQLSAGN